jgi:uncharacterized membrane protein
MRKIDKILIVLCVIVFILAAIVGRAKAATDCTSISTQIATLQNQTVDSNTIVLTTDQIEQLQQLAQKYSDMIVSQQQTNTANLNFYNSSPKPSAGNTYGGLSSYYPLQQWQAGYNDLVTKGNEAIQTLQDEEAGAISVERQGFIQDNTETAQTNLTLQNEKQISLLENDLTACETPVIVTQTQVITPVVKVSTPVIAITKKNVTAPQITPITASAAVTINPIKINNSVMVRENWFIRLIKKIKSWF